MSLLDLDFIEACYGPSLDEASWATSVSEAIGALLPGATRVMAAPYEVSLRSGLTYGKIAGDARYLATAQNRVATLARREYVNSAGDRRAKLRPFTNDRPNVLAVSELPPELRAPLQGSMPSRHGDILGMFGTLDGARGFVLGPSGPRSLSPPPRLRQKLERMSEHLAIGYWLRNVRAPSALADAVKAIYMPDGRTLERSGAAARSAPLNATLVDAVRSLDRARCRRQKRSPGEATELWHGLIAGEYALVESFERDGRRLILAVKCRSPRPLLTPRETAVAQRAARGLGNKLIGDELGIAPGTVAVHLRSALSKLDCPNRRALAHWL